MTTPINNVNLNNPVNLSQLRQMHAQNQKIACLTAYDSSFARAMDQAGVDVILIGDSLGMVVQGHDSTIPVTVDDIVYHSRAVARGIKRAFVIADMPFLADATFELALKNATRLMQEGGAKMIKIEGGGVHTEIVHGLTARGVPVCAHIGLRPQQVHKLGGFKVQGREAVAREQILSDAHAFLAAGVDMLLVECVPESLGTELRVLCAKFGVPLIGIGAGGGVDGQILVMHDLLGLVATGQGGRRPRFVKDFLAEAGSIEGAFAAYVNAVKTGEYPEKIHCF